MPRLPFNVSARTARLIGQENFSNAEGAVIELVKNSYDADATVCVIILDTINNLLYICDNGDGMSVDIVKKYWMTIGTDNKKSNIKSKASRVKTGAKGIGRFALDRLGRTCKMLTKTQKDDCVDWFVDWGQFDQANAVISDIKADIETLQNFWLPFEVINIFKVYNLDTELFKFWNDNKGTIIKIENLKDDWNAKSIELLYTNLESLIPPLETNSFNLFLYCSEEIEKFGEVKSALCDDYDYKVSAFVDDNSLVKIEVYRNELEYSELKRNGFFSNKVLKGERYNEETFKQGYFIENTSLANLLAGYKFIDKNNNLSKIGAFDFTFYFIKRGGGQDKEEEMGKYPYKSVNYRDRILWLDRFGGVKIFRDNFRVRPYGETNSSSFDWLELGKRALSNPTVTRPGYKVRPQQVYGVINISRIGNLNFDDKSSREGLQENDIFLLFKEVVKSIIEVFENDRNQIMMVLKKIYDEKNKKQKAQSDADEIIHKKKKNAKNKKANNDNGNTNSGDDSKSNKGGNEEEESEILIEAIEAYKEEIDELRDEQKLLRVLASAGLIVTSFAHELKNLSDNLIPRTDDLKEILQELIQKEKLVGVPSYLDPYVMIEDMKAHDIRLKNWLDFAIASVRKDKRSRRVINMVAYIDNLERSWKSLLSRRRIKLFVEKGMFVAVNFRGYEIDLDGIFNNLIANSVDAFGRSDSSEKREIKLSFSFSSLSETGISVIYEDSGPGLSSDILDVNKIFQPFFTTKRDERTGEKIGTGLGMWIVKSAIDEYNGTIEILNSRPGFKLKIKLPHY